MARTEQVFPKRGRTSNIEDVILTASAPKQMPDAFIPDAPLEMLQDRFADPPVHAVPLPAYGEEVGRSAIRGICLGLLIEAGVIVAALCIVELISLF